MWLGQSMEEEEMQDLLVIRNQGAVTSLCFSISAWSYMDGWVDVSTPVFVCEAAYAWVYIHCICTSERIACFSVAVILPILCVCVWCLYGSLPTSYEIICQSFSCGPDSCLLSGLGGMKCQEGGVSKTIKKDWLLSVSCETADCFLIF